MKTITGKITSSTPVSISKAASIVSKFVSAETGASQAICAYLRRANAAFDELARIHSKSDRRKQSRHKSKKTQSEEVNAEKLSLSEFSPEVKRKMKNENKKNEERGHFGNPVDNSESKVLSNGEGIHKNKHKKKQDGEREIGLAVGYKENGGKVVGKEGEDEGTTIIKEGKKKRKNEEVDEKKEDEGPIIVKEEGKKKKRKSEEVAEKGEDGSEEKRRTKKRRRSGEGES